MGVFCFGSDFSDRPEWGVFVCIFPDFLLFGAESGIIDFKGRKTGLFKPVWLADLLVDQTYLLITRGSGERDFFGIDGRNEKEE